MTKKEFVSLLGEQARSRYGENGDPLQDSYDSAGNTWKAGYGTRELAVNANNIFGMKAELSGNNWPSDWGGQTLHKGNERTEAERRSLHNNGSVPKI